MRVAIAGTQNINMAPSQLPRSESEMPASHPYSPCSWHDCPQPAAFVMGDGRLCCHGHSNSKLLRTLGKEELPFMWATHCYSGDTWVTCDAHKGAYAFASRKSPKRIRTAVTCEICSADRDEL